MTRVEVAVNMNRLTFLEGKQSLQMNTSNAVPGIRACISGLLVSLLAACSTVTPTPVGQAELEAESQRLAEQAYSELPDLNSVLTLPQAQARALKYNLELRTRMMEESLALGQLQVARYDMLPSLIAQAGYNTRNNERVNQSRDTETGELVRTRFISQERSHELSQLGLSWNLIDFGVSYYNARQQAERLNIASERRRKMLHQVMQDVHIAYWRVAAAQRLRDDLQIAMRDAEAALTDARAVQRELVDNLGENLRYQRELLENLRLLEAINSELSTAQVELALLVNVPAGYPIIVQDPEVSTAQYLLEMPIEEVEELALARNPDVLERYYDSRIARLESRKVLAQMFPNLRLDYGVNTDDDLYLINNDWTQASAQLTYNLLDIFSVPARNRLAKAGVSLADQRLMMVQVATLSQVHLGRLDLAASIQQLARSSQLMDVDRSYQHLQVNALGVGSQSRLDMVVGQTSLLLSTLRFYQAQAALESSRARFLFTLGVEPEIASVQDTSLDDLAASIEQFDNAWATADAR